MPYVIKTATRTGLEPGTEILLTENCMYDGGRISDGDEAFIWFSGAESRLAWQAVVVGVGPYANRSRAVRVRLTAASVSTAPSVSDLVPLRNVRDGSPMSELSRKLYKHALNKIAAISEPEAALLRGFFS